jgi:homogentisate 1,2-dioxygenase
MIDPFRPVKITKAAMELEVEDYYKSWFGAEAFAN